MFTKCPSCHTEISFEPPKNAPAGYKHRLKCPNPNCGVTISVVIPSKQPAEQTVSAPNMSQQQYTNHNVGGVAPQQPQYQQYPPYPPQYPPYQYAPYNGYAPQPYPAPYPPYPMPQQNAAESEKKEPEKTGRWSGSLPKSLTILILSLGFLIFHVLGFLVHTGKLAGNSAVFAFEYFNGITYIDTLIKNGASALSGVHWAITILNIISLLSFIIACLSVVTNLFIAIFSGYGKGAALTNIVFGAIIFIGGILTAVYPFIDMMLNGMTGIVFTDYLKSVLTTEGIALLLGVVIGLLLLILSVVFLLIKATPLPKKEKKVRPPKEPKVKEPKVKEPKVKEPKVKKEKAKKQTEGQTDSLNNANA